MAENIIGPRKLGGGPSRDPNDKSGGSSKKGSGKSLNDALKSTADQNKGKDKGKGGKNKKPESGSVADQGKDKGKNDKNKKPESGLGTNQNKDKKDKDKKDKDKKDSSMMTVMITVMKALPIRLFAVSRMMTIKSAKDGAKKPCRLPKWRLRLRWNTAN